MNIQKPASNIGVVPLNPKLAVLIFMKIMYARRAPLTLKPASCVYDTWMV
jgi:hypothetical protein